MKHAEPPRLADEWDKVEAIARWALDVVEAAARSDNPALRSTADNLVSTVGGSLQATIAVMAEELEMPPPEL